MMKKQTYSLRSCFLLSGISLLLIFSSSTSFAMGAESGKSVLDLYREGGPVMHLIALSSILTVSLAVYCALLTRRTKAMPPHLLASLQQMMSQQDVASAFQMCQASPGPFTNALASALVKANFSRDMYNKPAMEGAIADACFREETRIMATVNYLNTAAALAPMIGLLGTVSGMISSFSALTAGKAEATDLAKGIGEALIATGGGLLLAIPAMFCYFFFRGKASVLMADVHQKLAEMLDFFTGENVIHQPSTEVAGG